jgi:uncharacterized protein YjbJ (UPF0337 family)
MRDKIRGKAQNIRGRVKEAAGALTGNKRRQLEGTADRVKGAAREEFGEAKRSVGEGLDAVSRRIKR